MSNRGKGLGFESSGSESGSGNEESSRLPLLKRRKASPKISLKIPKGNETPEKENTMFATGSIDENEREEDYLTMEIQECNSQSLFGDKVKGLPKNDDDDDDDDDDVAKMMPKGFRMMSKMGFKVGQTLGSKERASSAIKVPIKVDVKLDRRGIKEQIISKVSGNGFQTTNTEDYRKRLQQFNEQKRKERILYNLQKLSFEMSGDLDGCLKDIDPRDFNVLWRQYVIELQKKTIPKDGNNSEDESSNSEEKDHIVYDEEVGLNSELEQREGVEPDQVIAQNSPENSMERGSLISYDEELQLFQDMSIDERIFKIHTHLRSEFYYCFYCGAKYQSEEDMFKNCPGTAEEDHQ